MAKRPRPLGDQPPVATDNYQEARLSRLPILLQLYQIYHTHHTSKCSGGWTALPPRGSIPCAPYCFCPPKVSILLFLAFGRLRKVAIGT
ncbi:hypothetical protein DIRU0_C17128 [Diutina rugosa]